MVEDMSGGAKRIPRLGYEGGQWVLAIMVLALILRTVYLLQAREHLYFNAYSDFLHYRPWAEDIVRGQPGPPVFFLGPLYPYMLAFFYRIFGPRPEVVLWFQVLLGSASCGLIYLLGRMVFSRAVGLLAALMGALYVVEIFYEGALLTTTVLYVLNLAFLVSILWALGRRRWFFWVIPGLLLGLSALGRANVLIFLPFLVLGIFLLSRGGGKREIRWMSASLALLLGVFVVIAPVTVRNVVVGHDLVVITSNLGLNFFVGNNPDAPGFYQRPKGLDVVRDFSGAKIAGWLTGRELSPSQVSRFWLQRALAFVRAQPGAFLRLGLKKLLFFWNAYEIPQAENLEFSKRFIPLLRWPLLTFSLLGPLGLLGMALSLGQWRRIYFPVTFVLSLMGITVLFFVISRLRLQVCSVLMVFAAYALIWLWERLRARKVQQLALAIVALIPLIMLVNWPHPALNSAKFLAISHNLLAKHFLRKGDLQGAYGEFERAVAVSPHLGEAYVTLADLNIVQGRLDEALDLCEKALQVDPQIRVVHLNLGNLYAQKGMWDEAITEYRAEIKASPYDVKAHEALSRALEEQEKLSGGQLPDR